MTNTAVIQANPGDIITYVQANRNVSIATHNVAIRRPLSDLVEATITAAAHSPHTARTYRRAIGKFVSLLETERIDVLRGTVLVEKHQSGPRKVVAYNYGDTPSAVLLLVDAPLLDLYRRQVATNHYHAARTFLSVAYRDNVLTDDQARSLGIIPYRAKTRHNHAPAGRRLSVTEVQSLRASIDTATNAGKRDRSIIDTMLFCGLRREEVANLDLSDFQPEQGRWAITIAGKGDKLRKLIVPRTLYTSLESWLAAYDKALGDNDPLFVRINKAGRIAAHRLSSQSIANLTVSYGHKAGLAPLTGSNRLAPHDLRRTFARRAYDLGAGLPAIQVALGHSDPKTTALYIGLGQDEGAAVTELIHY